MPITMTAPATQDEPRLLWTGRVSPQQSERRESAVPLSLLDATTANFGLTSAVWLLERPNVQPAPTNLSNHLRATLGTTLNAYPQWCGFLKSIRSIDGDNGVPETSSFPLHAKRYGRVYVHYGTGADPGVEFVEATSTTTVDSLYRSDMQNRRPVWNRREDGVMFTQYVPQTVLVHALQPNTQGTDGLYRPAMAIQYTQLACGGFVLAAKIAHPLADITALTRFMKDWASVSSAMLAGAPLPTLSPVFEPLRLDECAAGDLNADDANPAVMEEALALPMHRYDWWAPPAAPPSPFPADLPLAGKPLPWVEWDAKAPVDQYTIHFSRTQIEELWRRATQVNSTEAPHVKISRHDALLAHIWSCVVRARGLSEDQGPVHCDLVLSTRPAFQLEDSFIGSPVVMLNIEMTASSVASGAALGMIANRIRETLTTVNDARRLATHMHSIAYEKSPQRIWQAFLGQRHILVTTWARAGIYDIDFGLGSRIRYADGVTPCMDGCVLIADGPPIDSGPGRDTAKPAWTDNGVDITLPLRCEDMERLLQDPLLLPAV
ncbi:transferase family protein [Curvularia clavata]|uniref:Transferase family protein n=1 Tax=Curvularia clavata TaxID=95742 RepID=A0A9Q8ZIG4_CURCL|nr:transferase family protein [Curvularia clavata]